METNNKLREALEYLRDASRDFCHLILNSKHNEVFDKYKYAEVAKIRDAIANANAALAEPPRNCDRYATPNDAMKAFEAFVRQQGKLGFINPYTEAFKWLFAPASAKEGGDNAKE